MNIAGRPTRTIWPAADGSGDVEILDQTRIPHAVATVRLRTLDDAVRAIAEMQVRGAPLIGVAAAYGVCLGLREDASDEGLERTHDRLLEARPTAVNLAWALKEMLAAVRNRPRGDRLAAASARAAELADADVATCEAIGEHGARLIAEHAERKGGGRVEVLTHCNAGWLATVDWGTALAPIYKAHRSGVDVHVWVDETRPRNQGASLTAFELGQEGVPHTIIADNTGGHLMQHEMVDLCIVGSDRTTRTGDVCNKIGTYLKALAAHDNSVPFYVALPSSTIDWSLTDGVAQILIEQRSAEEVTRMTGRTATGEVVSIDIAAPGSPAANYAFDVTPARLVSGIITERGVCAADEAALALLFPEHRPTAPNAG
ncbi:S-methyl-5-thioribose-1-phosphate isomerase [Caulobacter sp. S45]|uniref:S-methyl-5-thioribose-1-phosphate isomerase n=1 Tax=Caulobacter sp. S45 TaxID=1641861 RepID=UPI001575BA9D|nr:S-methyl-5-thioribose-1-phosphate isomerase [Caulobacter sp. S45]